MDTKKIIKNASGVVALSAGVVCKLAELGLSVSEVVLCGAKNLANEFVKAPDLHIGDSLLKDAQKGTQKLSQKLFKKAKELL